MHEYTSAQVVLEKNGRRRTIATFKSRIEQESPEQIGGHTYCSSVKCSVRKLTCAVACECCCGSVACM